MNALKYVATALLSAGVATLVTAKVMEKIMLKEIDERVDQEVKASLEFLEFRKNWPQSRTFEERVAKNVETPLQETRSDEDEEAAKKNQLTRYDQVIQQSGYGDTPSDEDLAEAIEEHEAEIYAIPVDEFMENENGWMQGSMSIYADGGVLDDQGEIVADWRSLIGSLDVPFGLLSGEPHIVYLRNTKHKMEFEVIRDEANAADILGSPVLTT